MAVSSPSSARVFYLFDDYKGMKARRSRAVLKHLAEIAGHDPTHLTLLAFSSASKTTMSTYTLYPCT